MVSVIVTAVYFSAGEIKNRDKKLAGISEHEINDCAEDETEVA